MSAELIGFICAIGGVITTALGFWLKTVVPNIIKWRQSKEMKELESNIKIKERDSISDRTATEKLIEIGFGVVNRLPDLIEKITAGQAKTSSDIKDVHIDLIGRLELIKNQVTSLEMTIKDLKIENLKEQKCPESRVSIPGSEVK